MKIKIVTAIYNNLYNSKYGGRASRNHHYIFSLHSLMKMNNAHFVLYTSYNEYDELKEEFKNYPDLEIIAHELIDSPFQKIIQEYKNYEEAKLSDRCVEIQYLKLHWLNQQAKDCDYIYWFDAGLSHVALIPDKWLECRGERWLLPDYYYSDFFTNTFINNLTKISKDKIFLIIKDNLINGWSQEPLQMFNEPYNYKWHVIGGVFGGKSLLIRDFYNLYYDYSVKTAEQYKEIWFEENILTVMYYNNSDMFVTKDFDIWTHENNTKSEHIGGRNVDEYLATNKPFYKLLEEIYYNDTI
jgi:hypothetical protein